MPSAVSAGPRRIAAKRVADDRRLGQPGRPYDGLEPDTAPVLDLSFDASTLDVLRAEVKAHACQAGLPEARAEDVVLAVHELAANAVHHGAGAGRLRMWKVAGALRCQVHDDGTRASVDPVGPRFGHAASEVAHAADCSRPEPLNSLRGGPGHGLWVMRQMADRMQVLSGARGTRATVTFDLPGG
jgi:anti-sigma regulatory factor (Ser/Thr protein kinase)